MTLCDFSLHIVTIYHYVSFWIITTFRFGDYNWEEIYDKLLRKPIITATFAVLALCPGFLAGEKISKSLEPLLHFCIGAHSIGF